MKLRFLCLAVVVALFALAFVSFDMGDGNARGKAFAAKFADNKLSADESTGSYEIDAKHSYIGFRVTHMGLTEVPGSFRDFSGTITYDGKDVTKSSVNFTAKVTSVDTGVDGRDTHLRSKDFFEVETFPDMTFKSTKVEKKGKNLLVTGDFTLKGITKQITIPFTMLGVIKDQRGNMHIGIAATTMINRQDYGVKWSQKLDNGSLAVDDMVKVDLQIDAAKKK